jgi:iron(III) transport system permease protein
LIALWNSPRLPDIYGTTAMPVLASLARFAPLATLAVLAQLRQVDRELIDAARVHQSSHLQGWLQVRLPMLAPGLLAAAGVAFALSLGELGATLLVAPPGQSTLSMRIYNYLHYGASDAVAGLCLLLALSAVAAGLLAMTALLGWSRLLPSSGGQA